MSEMELQSALEQMNMLKMHISGLEQLKADYTNILNEAILTIESIRSLAQNPDAETLVTLGMRTLIPVKILPGNKIILNIGANVAVEKDFDSAINYLEARIKEIETALQTNVTEQQSAKAQLDDIYKKANVLAGTGLPS